MTQQENSTGHRARLRQRFLADPAVLSEVEMLELLLTYAIPRRDVAPLAQALVDRFGSADRVLTASYEELIVVLVPSWLQFWSLPRFLAFAARLDARCRSGAPALLSG